MALLLVEGFEYLVNSAQFAQKYNYHTGSNNNSNFNLTGRFGGTSAGTYSTWAPTMYFTGYNFGSTLIVGYALRSATTFVTDSLFKFFDSNSVCQVNVSMTSDGYIHVYRNTTEIGSVLSIWPNANQWRYMECKVVISPTVGSVEIRMDEVTILNLTGVNTQGTALSSIARFELTPVWSGGTNLIDDMYFCDTTGPSNNDFLGDCVAETVLPNAAGNYSQFTPLSGANYTNVDEGQANTTDYVSTNVLNNIDTYRFTPFTTGGTIRGVQWNAWHRKDNAGMRKIAAVARIGGNDYVHPVQHQCFADWICNQALYDVNPYTTAFFTMAELNASEFGVKLVV